MIKDRARIGVAIALFFTLVVYHIFSVVGQLGEANHLPTSIMKLYQIAALMPTALFFVWAIDANFLIRGVLRNNYIGGVYKGKSEDYGKCSGSAPPDRSDHIEEFRISQTLFSVTLSGCSYLADGAKKLVASYKGEQFKWDRGNAVFAIEMTTDTTEYGVLEISFHNESADGVYWSTNPSTRIPARFTVTRVS
ncbi:hypothetical protein [Synechococcus sp. MW101C3]|uniref:hypothetical protein n=1 Tax=Synechococcus sp. MW101C3 TaxID=210768 RepID=UPI0011818AA4|nr:hypothetical protein [Synechococcus sp. MW101C3]